MNIGCPTVAPNNGAPAPAPADPVDKCKAEANAAAAQEPSMMPNQSSLLTGVMGYVITVMRTGSQKAGWQGFLIGNLTRPLANAYLKSAAYTNTMSACMAAADTRPSPVPSAHDLWLDLVGAGAGLFTGGTTSAVAVGALIGQGAQSANNFMEKGMAYSMGYAACASTIDPAGSFSPYSYPG